MTALTLVQAQAKVDAFVARFNAKADQTALEAETSARQSAVANILENVDPEALDSFTEVVSAFQAADDDLNGAITTLAAQASTATAAVQANLTNYINATDAALAAEAAARQAADSTIATNLSDYATSNDARSTAIEAHVDAVEAKVDYAIENLPEA